MSKNFAPPDFKITIYIKEAKMKMFILMLILWIMLYHIIAFLIIRKLFKTKCSNCRWKRIAEKFVFDINTLKQKAERKKKAKKGGGKIEKNKYNSILPFNNF